MLRTYNVAVLPGDGIGPDVVKATIKVLNALQKVKKDLKLSFIFGEAGYNCIDKYGTNVPKNTFEILKNTDACLKGPMTTPEEIGAPPSAAVTIRKKFNLYANLRPCKSYFSLGLKKNIDLIIIRENTEGLYFGQEFLITKDKGVAMRVVTYKASQLIAKLGFKIAISRKKHLTCVHKRNILRITDGIFRKAIFDMSEKFKEVQLDEVRVDAMAMRLIKEPENFDVILATNLFGDILSDEAAQLTGGLGLAAGANVGDNYAMFEPVHGSAPKYTGKNKVNPMATILASKLMLEYLNENESAKIIENAVEKVLVEEKILTFDLGGTASTFQVADEIVKKILKG